MHTFIHESFKSYNFINRFEKFLADYDNVKTKQPMDSDADLFDDPVKVDSPTSTLSTV